MSPRDRLDEARAWAVDRPAEALVTVWQALGDHQVFQRRFSIDRCEAESALALEDLLAHDPVRSVHPVAFLSACDEYLSILDARHERRLRKVVLTADRSSVVHLVPRRSGWASRLSEQHNHRDHWMRHYQVVPADHRGIAVELVHPPARLAERLAGGEIAFAAGGFEDGVSPDWISTFPYRCDCLTDAGARWATVEGLLEAGAGIRAEILLFPELTLDAEVVVELRAWLRSQQKRHRFALVVAGSFHEAGPERGSPRRNVAHVLDGYGDEVCHHVKLQPMRISSSGRVKAEDIEGGAFVRLIHTELGLVGVAICLDYCEGGDTPVSDLWNKVGPALMLVPSMGGGTTIRAHGVRAKDLALQHGTVTLVASQHPKDSSSLGRAWTSPSDKDRSCGKPALHGMISTR